MNIRVVLVEADCSRGKGRNIGIRMVRNELIAVTDVGCRPHEKWLEKNNCGPNKGPAFRLAKAGPYL